MTAVSSKCSTPRDASVAPGCGPWACPPGCTEIDPLPIPLPLRASRGMNVDTASGGPGSAVFSDVKIDPLVQLGAGDAVDDQRAEAIADEVTVLAPARRHRVQKREHLATRPRGPRSVTIQSSSGGSAGSPGSAGVRFGFPDAVWKRWHTHVRLNGSWSSDGPLNGAKNSSSK